MTAIEVISKEDLFTDSNTWAVVKLAKGVRCVNAVAVGAGDKILIFGGGRGQWAFEPNKGEVEQRTKAIGHSVQMMGSFVVAEKGRKATGSEKVFLVGETNESYPIIYTGKSRR